MYAVFLPLTGQGHQLVHALGACVCVVGSEVEARFGPMQDRCVGVGVGGGGGGGGGGCMCVCMNVCGVCTLGDQH